MDPPQLSIASRHKLASRVHHQDVVAHYNVPLVPDMVVDDSSVIQNRVDGLAYCRALGGFQPVNGDLCGLELGLVLRPRLVIAEARLPCDWMRCD